MNRGGSADTITRGIGVRETLDADAATKRRLLVHCEPRRAAVELMECHDCDRCTAVRLPTALAPGAVECWRVAGADRPPVAAGPHAPVRLVMERDVTCVRPEAGVDAAARRMIASGVASAPVVDESGHPVGVISLAGAMGGRPDAGSLPGAPLTAGDVMNPLVFMVFENAELARAAAVMSAAGLQQLPVVRDDGSIAGLLTSHAVARWNARSES